MTAGGFPAPGLQAGRGSSSRGPVDNSVQSHILDVPANLERIRAHIFARPNRPVFVVPVATREQIAAGFVSDLQLF